MNIIEYDNKRKQISTQLILIVSLGIPFWVYAYFKNDLSSFLIGFVIITSSAIIFYFRMNLLYNEGVEC